MFARAPQLNVLPAFRPHQLDLIRRTVAGDCTAQEFDLFIEAAQHYRLDPFRRQILPLVFSKHKPDKRRMVILVSVDGQRIIAQRSGNYRPASEPAEVVTNKRLKGPTNPLGIVYARTKLFQQDNRGEWFPVVGEAFWEEFAPIRDEWAENPETRRYQKTGEKVLDPRGNWVRMPRLMIVKCATMQALRAGWPEEFGGLYAEEEMERAKTLDLAASEIVARQHEENRLLSIAARDTITVSWGGDWSLENVPLGQFADRVLGWMQAPGRTPQEVAQWADANREPLRLFWARAPADALELKKEIEARSRPTMCGANGAESAVGAEPGAGSSEASVGQAPPRADSPGKHGNGARRLSGRPREAS